MIDDEDEPSLCGACNGSGEGMYDGSRCGTCGGSGEISDSDYDAELERQIARAEYLDDMRREEAYENSRTDRVRT